MTSRAEHRRKEKFKRARERKRQMADEAATQRLPPPGAVKLEPLKPGQTPTASWVHQRALKRACDNTWEGCRYVDGQLRIPVAYFLPYAVPAHPTEGPVRLASEVAQVSAAQLAASEPERTLDPSRIEAVGSTGASLTLTTTRASDENDAASTHTTGAVIEAPVSAGAFVVTQADDASARAEGDDEDAPDSQTLEVSLDEL